MAHGDSGQFATAGLHKDVHAALLAARAPEQNEEDFFNTLDEEAVFILLNDPNLNRALANRVWQSILESRYRSEAVHGANAPRLNNLDAPHLNNLDAMSQPDEWIHQWLTSQVVPKEDQLAQSCSRLTHHSSACSSWGVWSTGRSPSMWDNCAHLDKQDWKNNAERETAPQASDRSGPGNLGLRGFNQPHPHCSPVSSSHPSASLAPASNPFSSNIRSQVEELSHECGNNGNSSCMFAHLTSEAADDNASEADEVAA